MTKETKAKATPIKLLTGAAAISTAITSLAARGKRYETDLHIAAVSTLNHAILHGDVTLANKLITALGKSQRVNALRDWFINFGPFSYDATNKTMAHVKGSNKTDLTAAMAMPFWEFKQEAAYVPFDFQAAILTLVKRAAKAQAIGDKVDKATLSALAALAGTTVTAVTAKPEKATRANAGSTVKDVLAA